MMLILKRTSFQLAHSPHCVKLQLTNTSSQSLQLQPLSNMIGLKLLTGPNAEQESKSLVSLNGPDMRGMLECGDVRTSGYCYLCCVVCYDDFITSTLSYYIVLW